MRLFLSALAFLALVCASHQWDYDRLIVNDVVDGLLARFSKNLKIPSLPSLKVQDSKTKVNIEADGGAAVGSVSLTHSGDATLFIDSYGNPLLDLNVGVDSAEITYNYKSEVAGKSGPSGNFVAKVGPSYLSLLIVMFPADSRCRLALDRNEIFSLDKITVEDGTVNANYNELLVKMLTDARETYLEYYLKEAWSKYWYCSTLEATSPWSTLERAAGVRLRNGPALRGKLPVRRFRLRQ